MISRLIFFFLLMLFQISLCHAGKLEEMLRFMGQKGYDSIAPERLKSRIVIQPTMTGIRANLYSYGFLLGHFNKSGSNFHEAWDGLRSEMTLTRPKYASPEFRGSPEEWEQAYRLIASSSFEDELGNELSSIIQDWVDHRGAIAITFTNAHGFQVQLYQERNNANFHLLKKSRISEQHPEKPAYLFYCVANTHDQNLKQAVARAIDRVQSLAEPQQEEKTLNLPSDGGSIGTLNALPIEILKEIGTYLSFSDLVTFSKANKKTRRAITPILIYIKGELSDSMESARRQVRDLREEISKKEWKDNKRNITNQTCIFFWTAASSRFRSLLAYDPISRPILTFGLIRDLFRSSIVRVTLQQADTSGSPYSFDVRNRDFGTEKLMINLVLEDQSYFFIETEPGTKMDLLYEMTDKDQSEAIIPIKKLDDFLDTLGDHFLICGYWGLDDGLYLKAMQLTEGRWPEISLRSLHRRARELTRKFVSGENKQLNQNPPSDIHN